MADGFFIGIDVTGEKEIANKIAKLPYAVADDGVEEANVYILAKVSQNAPSHRGEPFRWSSDRQRRAAFAKMREQGGPPYRRTQQLRKGWELLGSGRNQIIINEVPYAKWVKDKTQIIGHRLREWTTVDQDIKQNMARILQKFQAGAKKAMKKLGL